MDAQMAEMVLNYLIGREVEVRQFAQTGLKGLLLKKDEIFIVRERRLSIAFLSEEVDTINLLPDGNVVFLQALEEEKTPEEVVMCPYGYVIGQEFNIHKDCPDCYRSVPISYAKCHLLYDALSAKKKANKGQRNK